MVHAFQQNSKVSKFYPKTNDVWIFKGCHWFYQYHHFLNHTVVIFIYLFCCCCYCCCYLAMAWWVNIPSVTISSVRLQLRSSVIFYNSFALCNWKFKFTSKINWNGNNKDNANRKFQIDLFRCKCNGMLFCVFLFFCPFLFFFVFQFLWKRLICSWLLLFSAIIENQTSKILDFSFLFFLFSLLLMLYLMWNMLQPFTFICIANGKRKDEGHWKFIQSPTKYIYICKRSKWRDSKWYMAGWRKNRRPATAEKKRNPVKPK